MDAVLAMHICILLVDNNRASSVRESLLLRLSKYQVVTADTGKEALHMLRTTNNSFNLVLTAMFLPDIDIFDFMRKVDVETRLPVVMMSDYYDQATITKALMGGAMRCLLKPLSNSDIKTLWQIPLSMQRRVMAESRQFPMMCGLPMCGGPSNDPLMRAKYRKRKAGDPERTGWFIGESSSPVCPDVKHKLQKLVKGLPRFYSAPQVVARRNYALGTSNALLVEKQQCKLESRRSCSDTASSSRPMADQQANRCVRYKGPLKRYLENHHSREQLRRLIVVTLSKWDVVPKALSVTRSPPSPPSDVPPISVPFPVAAYIENFIDTTMAVGRAPPGFVQEVLLKAQYTGPSVLAEFWKSNKELEPRLVDELDTEELFDAIEELRD